MLADEGILICSINFIWVVFQELNWLLNILIKEIITNPLYLIIYYFEILFIYLLKRCLKRVFGDLIASEHSEHIVIAFFSFICQWLCIVDEQVQFPSSFYFCYSEYWLIWNSCSILAIWFNLIIIYLRSLLVNFSRNENRRILIIAISLSLCLILIWKWICE